MLINLSNHPSATWPEDQLSAAEAFGGVTDLPFPTIDPEADIRLIEELAEKYEIKLRKLRTKEADFEHFAVHLMGELTFCFALVVRLQQQGITCIASTTTRISTLREDGAKTSHFRFVRFRVYPMIHPVK